MTINKQNCYLRAFEPEDYKITHKWRNDPDLTNLLTGNKYFVSSEREKHWVEEKIKDDSKEIYLAICDKNTHEMVGMVCINNIDFRNSKASIGGMTLGKEHWKKGYGVAAQVLLLKYVFEELGLNKLSTNYLVEHDITKRSLKKFGFKIEGVARQDIFKNGKYHDVEYASLLKKEYFEGMM